jgi:hypothetical protein
MEGAHELRQALSGLKVHSLRELNARFAFPLALLLELTLAVVGLRLEDFTSAT